MFHFKNVLNWNVLWCPWWLFWVVTCWIDKTKSVMVSVFLYPPRCCILYCQSCRKNRNLHPLVVQNMVEIKVVVVYLRWWLSVSLTTKVMIVGLLNQDFSLISLLYIKVADLSLKNIFGNNPPQMVPMDLNNGFQGLALIQGQIYKPVYNGTLCILCMLIFAATQHYITHISVCARGETTLKLPEASERPWRYTPSQWETSQSSKQHVSRTILVSGIIP